MVVCSQPERSKRKKRSWVEQHWSFATRTSGAGSKAGRSRSLRPCQSNPWESGIPDCELQTRFPALRLLTPREFDLLHTKLSAEFPEATRRTIDVSPTISWATAGNDDAGGTLTGGAKLYLTDRCRSFVGIEAFSMMGINYVSERQDRLMSFRGTFLVNLAGNAFHCWSCVPSVFCGLRLRAELASRRREREGGPRAPGQAASRQSAQVDAAGGSAAYDHAAQALDVVLWG